MALRPLSSPSKDLIKRGVKGNASTIILDENGVPKVGQLDELLQCVFSVSSQCRRMTVQVRLKSCNE